MKENQKELDELIQEVMEQMRERRYGKKIVTRYRSSFQLLMTLSHDIGDEIASLCFRYFIFDVKLSSDRYTTEHGGGSRIGSSIWDQVRIKTCVGCLLKHKPVTP